MLTQLTFWPAPFFQLTHNDDDDDDDELLSDDKQQERQATLFENAESFMVRLFWQIVSQ